MKIEENYQNLMEAWWIVAAALDTIKALFIDNTNNVEAKEAYNILLLQSNKWNDEIKKMPF